MATINEIIKSIKAQNHQIKLIFKVKITCIEVEEISYELSEFFKNNHITDLEISGKLKKL